MRSSTPTARRSTTRTCSCWRVVGDGEAETGPLAASWHSNKFIDPARDGAVLPVLHLNGYKIANPTVLARIPKDELRDLMRGYGHEPVFVEGDEPEAVHQALAAALDGVLDDIAEIQRRAREDGDVERPRWPMIVLRTPKGWTGPREVDGVQVEDSWRSHQVPLAQLAERPDHLAQLEQWLRSYKPEELFDERGAPKPELTELAPEGARRMGANPHANGGILLKPLRMPDFRKYAVDVPAAGGHDERGDARDGRVPARRHGPELGQLPRLRARRDGVEPPRRAARGHRQGLDGRAHRARRSPRARRARGRGAERAPLPGLAGGLPPHRAATASSTATRPSSTSSTRCSTSTRSG